MAAIITEKFRQHNADQFFESFSEASASTYYIFVGKATAFTSGTTGGSDSSPPTPTDSPSDTEFYAWDSMIAAKNVGTSDITYSCLLYTSPSPRDRTRSRMPSSA